MATNKQEQAKAIYELWDVILQHRWRFVLPAFTITAIVLFGSLFLPRKYEATAHFERRNAPELTEAIKSGASESYMDPIPALTKDIAGSHAIAQVIQDLKPRLEKVGYVNNDADLLKLRTQVKQQLLVHREYADSKGVQLRLELVLDDPNIAALIVNGLVDRYIKITRTAMVDRARSSIAYYDQQIADHRVKLEAMQQELGEFEQEHALLLPEHPFSIQAQLGEAKEELSRLTMDFEGLESRRRTLTKAIDDEPLTRETVVHGANPERVRLMLKMEQLQEVILEHISKKRMTEKHPELMALREQEAELQSKIDQAQVTIVTSTENNPNPKRAQLEFALTQANAERDALSEQISVRRVKLDELTEMSLDILPALTRHDKLKEAVATAQQDVNYVKNLRRGADNYLTPETGNRGVQLEFLRRAEAVRQPVSPTLVQVALVAVFLGIAGGALSVFLAHRTDESFRNARQLTEATSIPLLGSVSELITRQHRRMRKLRYSLVYPMNAAVMASILVLIAGVLYLDLQRPDILNQLKDRAKSMVMASPDQPIEPSPAVGMIRPDTPEN